MADQKGHGTDTVTFFVSIEGEKEVLKVEAASTETAASLLSRIRNGELRDFTISREDSEEAVVPSATIGDVLAGEKRGRVHLHRCAQVAITLSYNGQERTNHFPPSATVMRVFEWAVGKQGFNVEADAHDLGLQLPGSDVALAPNVHIGTLIVSGHCALKLELVPKDRPQG